MNESNFRLTTENVVAKQSRYCIRDAGVMALVFFHLYISLLKNFNSTSYFWGLHGNLIHVTVMKNLFKSLLTLN